LPFFQTANRERQRHAGLQSATLRSALGVRWGQHVSHLFSPPETPNSKWQLEVNDHETGITINLFHYNSAGELENFVEPTLVKMSILNERGNKVLQQRLQSIPSCYFVSFKFSKEEIITSEYQQSDGTFTFYCKILSHAMKSKPISSSADLPVLAVDCTGGLSSHLEELFNDMSLSDVNFTIVDREIPAHKVILSARSKYFAAMFQHPMKEQSTNQIKIEDTEPEVFKELLRFIYTGRVSTATMETMAANLFIAADKYLLDELKTECENHLLHHLSPDNCVVLLLTGDLTNPAEPLKEAAKFLRRFPNEVMATDGWKKIKQENPVLLCDIQQFAFCF
jgi:speckle-type POZ protein